MKPWRVLYHMARADFLERTRRYSFLIMLGLVIWLGYAAAAGIITLTLPPNRVGEINSAWVGALMTVTVGFFLGLFGFYLVKGSVGRDYETGVGQILATTTLSRPLYTLGKWLSNFAVLGVMVLILMVAGVLMILFVGKAPLDLWALTSPLLFLSLPMMALIAAFAVVFDTIAWLRGGLGNVVYWFLFLFLLTGILLLPYSPLIDFPGQGLINNRIGEAALGYTPTKNVYQFGISASIIDPQWFHYSGITWTADLLLSRLFFLVLAVGLTLLAAVFFDRFNPSRELRIRRRLVRDVPAETPAPGTAALPFQNQAVRLTPLAVVPGLRFGGLYLAEVKLLVKRRRWWWYLVALGLIVAQVVAPLEFTPTMLAATWLWLISPLNELGNREVLRRTRELVFSAPHPALRQLPPLWLAAISLLILAGSGALVRYAWLGRTEQMLAWVSGVLFIPALATALGVLSNSRKLFEVVYVGWMYLILNDAPALDFVGVAPVTPWLTYVLAAVGLFALSALVRYVRLGGLRLRAAR